MTNIVAKEGDSGSSAKLVKDLLIKAGYLGEKHNRNERFDAATTAALSRFVDDMNIAKVKITDAKGYVSEDTKKLMEMMSDYAKASVILEKTGQGSKEKDEAYVKLYDFIHATYPSSEWKGEIPERVWNKAKYDFALEQVDKAKGELHKTVASIVTTDEVEAPRIQRVGAENVLA